VVHDVFLNDALDGPLPVALYSAALFTLTEGRAYSAAEYREWLREARLEPGEVVPTLIHCGLLVGTKNAVLSTQRQQVGTLAGAACSKSSLARAACSKSYTCSRCVLNQTASALLSRGGIGLPSS